MNRVKKRNCGSNFHEAAYMWHTLLNTTCVCYKPELHITGKIMAEEHVERFSMDCAVQGFHVYKDIWNPEIGEVLICEQEFGNLHNLYTVLVVGEDNIMFGHVP